MPWGKAGGLRGNELLKGRGKVGGGVHAWLRGRDQRRRGFMEKRRARCEQCLLVHDLA